MSVRLITLFGVSVGLCLATSCFSNPLFGNRSGDDFVIEEGGMILCRWPEGKGEIDLETGGARDIFDTPRTEPSPYIVGWRKDRVWIYEKYEPPRFHCRTAVSPYAGAVERIKIPELTGEDARRSLIGPVSRRLLLLVVYTKQGSRHLCLFNTVTGEIRDIWKAKTPELRRVRLPDGSSEWRGFPEIDFHVVVSPDGTSIKKASVELGKKTIIFDINKMKCEELPENLNFEKAVDEGGNLSGNRFSPAAAVLLLRDLKESLNEKDYRASWYRIWVCDGRTGKMKNVPHGEMGFNLLYYKWELSPDGKRTIVRSSSGRCFIYDLTTGIVAQVPRIERILYLPTWSPSGKYLACLRARTVGIMRETVPDLYVTEVTTGRNKPVAHWREGSRRRKGPMQWIAPPATKREANINYVKWLISLLEGGVEKEKIMYRLHEFTSQKGKIGEEKWKKWLEENEDYLAWSEKEKRLYLYAEAKAAETHVDVWETIPEDKRAAWTKLSEQEQQTLRDKTASDLSAQRKLEKAAWRAGVDPEVWVHIPEEKQKNWPELKTEERIKLVAEGKKKWLKEAGKPATNNGKDDLPPQISARLNERVRRVYLMFE